MRLIGRNDAVLLAGLAVALFVVFSHPISQLLDLAREIEQSSGLLLTPALVILFGVFVFHQLRKRVEMQAATLSAAAEAREATARAKEMERLVAFGHALARSLDPDAIRGAVLDHLPLLAPDRRSWVLMRTGDEWKPLAQVGDDIPDLDARVRAANRAIGLEVQPGHDLPAVAFPMNVGGTPVGVLGVMSDPPLHDEERRALVAGAAFLAVSIKNAELFREIRESSVRDVLTGCFNRRHTLDVIDAELRRAKRSHLPISLIMFDLDRFKEINDRYGHLCGDTVLAAVGHRLHETLRGSDVKCRYGGEEFLILLPDTPLSGAQRVADGLRRDFEAQPVTWEGHAIPITASFGVTGVAPGEIVGEAVIGRADVALYQAKEAGRNCIRTADAVPNA